MLEFIIKEKLILNYIADLQKRDKCIYYSWPPHFKLYLLANHELWYFVNCLYWGKKRWKRPFSELIQLPPLIPDMRFFSSEGFFLFFRSEIKEFKKFQKMNKNSSIYFIISQNSTRCTKERNISLYIQDIIFKKYGIYLISLAQNKIF